MSPVLLTKQSLCLVQPGYFVQWDIKLRTLFKAKATFVEGQ